MASKLGKALSLLLVLIIIAACTGCGEKEATPAAGEKTPAAKGLTAEQVVDNALAAHADARSYRFDTDMTLDMQGEVEGEKMEGTLSIDGSGVVDQANKEMEMSMSMDMEATGEEVMATEMNMYLVGDNMYMMAAVPGQEPMWMKQEVPAGFWETQAIVDQQLELLQAAEVKLLRDEEVTGVNCYVLEMTPDLDQLWHTVMQQPGMEEMAMEIPNLEDVIKQMSVKQWIAKDTFFLTKAQTQMTMFLTPEAMGVPEEAGEMTMSIAVDMLAYDYDNPVFIELPAEAESAMQVPSLK